jgi:DNA-binding NarL/FixJ family response regulator
MKIRILLADDHEVVRDGIRGMLEKQPDFEIAGVTGDGREAIEMVRHTDVDVIVMDVNMPHLSGMEATRQIKAISPGVKILTLSVHSRGPVIAQMIRAGASGYLPKTCATKELVEAIRAVMQGRTYISPGVLDSVTDYLRTEPDDSKEHFASLTPREREVLALIAEGKTTKEISNRLHLSERTVEFHRHNIMDKLQMRSVAELTKYAVREGLTPLENL